MNVKAQGLLNAVKWIEENYGRDALGEVIRACSAPVRERYVSAIAIDWHPVEELVELVGTADRMLGRGTGKIAERIGAAGARANMRGLLLRLVFYMSQPEFLIKRVAGLWRQFNDQGSMDLLSFGATSLQVEVRGVTRPSWVFCSILTGWCREVVAASGGNDPIAKHVSCAARGQSRCIWEVRYSGIREAGGITPTADSVRSLPDRPSVPPPSDDAQARTRRAK